MSQKLLDSATQGISFDPNGYFQNDIFMRGIGVDGLGGGGPLSNSEISALPPASDHHAQFVSGLAGFTGGLVVGAVGASILGPVSLGMSQAALLAPLAPVFANALANQWADFQNSSVSEKAFAVGSLIGGSCGFGTGRSLFTPKPTGLLSQFSKNELFANALLPYNKVGLTHIGRAWTKHAKKQRTSGTFPPLKGTVPEQNATAERLLREIMEHPKVVIENLGRGGVEFRHPDGNGVRFNSDGKLSGFVD